MPHGAYRVNHILGGEPVAFRCLGLPGLTAVKGAALGQELRARRPVDGPVHAPAPQQRGVGGVDNGVHAQFGDISGDDMQFHGGRPPVPILDGFSVPRADDGLQELTDAEHCFLTGKVRAARFLQKTKGPTADGCGAPLNRE